MRRYVWARKAHRDIGVQEPDLVAAIEARTVGLHGMEGGLADHLRHGVSQLDLVAGPALLLVQDGKDLRLQYVAADYAKVGRLCKVYIVTSGGNPSVFSQTYVIKEVVHNFSGYKATDEYILQTTSFSPANPNQADGLFTLSSDT